MMTMISKHITLGCVLALACLAAPLVAHSQTAPKLARIGWMSRGGPAPSDANMDAFRQGMRELGYIEDQSFAIEVSYANGQPELMPQQAQALEASGVDLIVIGPYEAGVAAKQSTRQVPIVMTPSVDPAATGVIADLKRPEGHITAITEMRPDLTPRRLQLLKQLAPGLHKVGILWQPGTLTKATIEQTLQATRSVGEPSGIQVQTYEAALPTDFEQAFAAMAKDHIDGLIVLSNPMFGMQRQQILTRAAALKLPVAYEWRTFVQGGGLIFYGPDVADVYRRAAGMADKIIKGAKPADLPVEGATLIELAVNLKAARELGLTVPDALLKDASVVVE